MKKLLSFLLVSVFVTGIIFAQSSSNDSDFRQSVKINPLTSVFLAMTGVYGTEVSYEYAVTDLFTVSPILSVAYTNDLLKDSSNISALDLGIGCGFRFNFFKNYLKGFYGEAIVGLDNCFLTDGIQSTTVYSFYLPLMVGYEGITKSGFVWDVGGGFDLLSASIKIRGNIGYAW